MLVTPRLAHIEPLDFAGGRASIDESYNTVRRMRPALQPLLDVRS